MLALVFVQLFRDEVHATCSCGIDFRYLDSLDMRVVLCIKILSNFPQCFSDFIDRSLTEEYDKANTTRFYMYVWRDVKESLLKILSVKKKQLNIVFLNVVFIITNTNNRGINKTKHKHRITLLEMSILF